MPLSNRCGGCGLPIKGHSRRKAGERFLMQKNRDRKTKQFPKPRSKRIECEEENESL